MDSWIPRQREGEEREREREREREQQKLSSMKSDVHSSSQGREEGWGVTAHSVGTGLLLKYESTMKLYSSKWLRLWYIFFCEFYLDKKEKWAMVINLFIPKERESFSEIDASFADSIKICTHKHPHLQTCVHMHTHKLYLQTKPENTNWLKRNS
jgi:hypothetical protein